MAILAVACSDKAELNYEVPLRPITPGFPPIRPRVNAQVPIMCRIKGGTISVPTENGVKVVELSLSIADSVVWNHKFAENDNAMAKPDITGKYTIRATTDDGIIYENQINL